LERTKKKKAGLFMVRTRKSLSNSACESEVREKFKANKFTILHHNAPSLWNKRRELTVLLNSSLQGTDALYFTEHWLNKDQLTLVEINNFKLVSKFCRKQSKSGGSCILVNKEVNTREVTILNIDPHSDVNIFPKKLELLIDRIHRQKKK
jgi:hypothetical protein